MASSQSNQHNAWTLDQLAKSEFFHQKLHEWGVLHIAYQIEKVKGETLEWDLQQLDISQTAWDRVIHRGIKPVVIFAHPEVLTNIPGSVTYYRMLSMASQKSMMRIGMRVNRYEEGSAVPDMTLSRDLAHHLNGIISSLIEADEEIDPREFDLWRGMAAGTQAQGSWQNQKGNRMEVTVKGRLRRRLQDKKLFMEEEADDSPLTLTDGRTIVFGDEPDVGIYRDDTIVAAVEIKGGIDTAGVLERVGAAMKSLARTKQENPDSVTILIMPTVSVTEQARTDLETNKATVNYWFTVEEFLEEEDRREELFRLLNI